VNIDLQACYRRRYDVRKRRFADHIYLIRDGSIFEMDEFSNDVWRLCDGSQTVLHTITVMKDRFPDVDSLRIAGLALYTIEFFVEHRLAAAE